MTNQATISPNTLKGFVLDIDGVLHRDRVPLAEAAEAVARLRAEGYGICFLTNVTASSRAAQAARLRAYGIEADPGQVFTASSVTADWLRARGSPRCYLLLTGSGRDEFTGLAVDAAHPEFVVVGEMGDSLRPALLNRALEALLSGAELIAIQKNRYWLQDGQRALDVGAYVAALEFASGKRATVIGKPAPYGYQTALRHLSLPAHQVAMVADDLAVDLAGARAVGMRTVLVENDIFGPASAQRGEPPDLSLPSIAALPAWLSTSP
jgi:phospholysine phosphohistidine inorganic pyrophosphate phosphatase